MRTLAAAILAAGILAAGMTLAQPPEGKRGGGMRGGMGGQQGGVMLLNNKSVQDELHITDEQKEKIKTFAEEQGRKMREKMQELGGGGGGGQRDPEMAKKIAEEMRKFGEEAMKELKEKKLLDDKQVARLKQIVWQQAGPHGTVSDEEVQKVVKLTGEQKEKYKSMSEEFQKDLRELMRASFGGDTDAQKKIEALRKEIKEKSVEVLTADQVKAWKELVGKEFEVKQEARTGGGGRGKRPEKKDPTR